MSNKTDFVTGIILLGVCGLFGWQISLVPRPEMAGEFSAASFPTGIVVLLAALALRLVYQGLKIAPEGAAWPERPILIKIGKMSVLMAVYILGFVYMGEYCYENDYPYGTTFILTTLLFLFIAQCWTRPGKTVASAVISLVMTGFLFATFFYLFKVQLP